MTVRARLYDALCLSWLILIGLYAITFGPPALHVLGEYLR